MMIAGKKDEEKKKFEKEKRKLSVLIDFDVLIREKKMKEFFST
jgi:hypothetical protein